MDSPSFNVPQSWAEVRIPMFKEIFETSLKAKKDMTEWSYLYKLEILSILAEIDTEDEEFDELEADVVFEALNTITFINYDPDGNNKKEMHGLTFREYDDMYNPLTLGEFIDLDYYFAKSYIDNIELICAIMYRKTVPDMFGNLIWEKNGSYNVEERAKLFEDDIITDVFGVVTKFLNFKQAFIKHYETMFEPTEEEEDRDIFEGLEEYEIMELKAELKREEALKVFAWERLVYDLSNGDITKQAAVLDMPLYAIFNKLLYNKLLNAK